MYTVELYLYFDRKSHTKTRALLMVCHRKAVFIFVCFEVSLSHTHTHTHIPKIRITFVVVRNKSKNINKRKREEEEIKREEAKKNRRVIKWYIVYCTYTIRKHDGAKKKILIRGVRVWSDIFAGNCEVC